jgi:2-phospho-L-lactate guanylyltransferase
MLAHLLAEAAASPALAGTVVVSRDAQVLAMAQEAGAWPLLETGQGINPALTQAAERAAQLGAGAILVLPADLPLVSRDDVAVLARSLPAEPGIVLTASPDGGTNALAMRPIHAIPFAFGVDSFARHRALAHAAGLTCAVVTSPTLAVDLDQPGDLWAVEATLNAINH